MPSENRFRAILEETRWGDIRIQNRLESIYVEIPAYTRLERGISLTQNVL